MKNLIITAIDGYTLNQLKPLLNSLAKHLDNTDIYLISSTNPTEIIIYLKALNVNAFWEPSNITKINGYLCKFRYLRKLCKILLPKKIINNLKVESFLHISNLRIFIALKILNRNFKKYDKVLLTDSRDVIFQSNPFSLIASESPATFGLEDVTIAEQISNKRWIVTAFGAKCLDVIGHNVVGCSGVVIGGKNEIFNYLKEQSKLLKLINKKIIGSLGYDQGTHNYLYYIQKPLFMKGLPNGNQLICSLATCHRDNFSITKDNKLQMLKTGSFPAIVHQYDRHKDIKAQLGF